MTLDEAKQEIPDFDTFATKYCDMCIQEMYWRTSDNEVCCRRWYGV